MVQREDVGWEVRSRLGGPSSQTASPLSVGTPVSSCPFDLALITTQRKTWPKYAKRRFCVATGSPSNRLRNLLML